MELSQTLYDIDDQGVATVTFNNEQKRNVMNPVFMDELGMVMDEAVARKARALIVTGAGRYFCAGGDLSWMQQQMELTDAERVAGSGQLAEFLTRLDELPMLTIARVNGPAFGGGIGIIAACDMAFAVASATFTLSEVRLGLSPSNISPIVVRRMGAANARRTFLNGKMMTAQLAQSLGLITGVTEDLDETIATELKSLAGCGPEAVAATKELVRFVSAHTDHENREYTARHLADAWMREEAQEGIKAFFEKRRPDWAPE